MAFSVSTHNGHSFGVMNMDIGKQMAKIQLWLKINIALIGLWF